MFFPTSWYFIVARSPDRRLCRCLFRGQTCPYLWLYPCHCPITDPSRMAATLQCSFWASSSSPPSPPSSSSSPSLHYDLHYYVQLGCYTYGNIVMHQARIVDTLFSEHARENTSQCEWSPTPGCARRRLCYVVHVGLATCYRSLKPLDSSDYASY